MRTQLEIINKLRIIFSGLPHKVISFKVLYNKSCVIVYETTGQTIYFNIFTKEQIIIYSNKLVKNYYMWWAEGPMRIKEL